MGVIGLFCTILLALFLSGCVFFYAISWNRYLDSLKESGLGHAYAKTLFFSESFLAFFVINCIAQFFKRFIYTFEEVISFDVIYYLVLFIPDIFLILWLILTVSFSVPKKLFFFLMYIGVIAVFSMLIGQGIGGVIITLRTIILPLILIFYFKCSYSFNDIAYLNHLKFKRHFYPFFATPLICITLSIFYSMYQFGIDYPYWDIRWDLYSPAQMNLAAISNSGKLNRAFGFFSEVANQGVALVFFMLYSYFFLKGVVKYFLIFFLIIGLIITGSKGAIAAFFLTIVLYPIIKDRKYYVFLLIAFLLLLIANARSFIYLAIELVRSLPSATLVSMLDPATFLSRVNTVQIFFKDMNFVQLLTGHGIGYVGGIVMDNLYLYLIYKGGVILLLLYLTVVYKVFSYKSHSAEHYFGDYFILFTLLMSMTSLVGATRNGIYLFMAACVFKIGLGLGRK